MLNKSSANNQYAEIWSQSRKRNHSNQQQQGRHQQKTLRCNTTPTKYCNRNIRLRSPFTKSTNIEHKPTILENKPHNGKNHFIYSASWDIQNSTTKVPVSPKTLLFALPIKRIPSPTLASKNTKDKQKQLHANSDPLGNI